MGGKGWIFFFMKAADLLREIWFIVLHWTNLGLLFYKYKLSTNSNWIEKSETKIDGKTTKLIDWFCSTSNITQTVYFGEVKISQHPPWVKLTWDLIFEKDISTVGKKCFCLREPVFWGGIFLILRKNFPNMEEIFS